jgi:hypothetical protein
MALRDASELLYPAVIASLASLGIDTADGGKDAAAAKLAQQYARVIDAATPGEKYAWAIRWLGPELQRILESLGGTPVARAAMKTAKPSADAKPNRLAQLRAAHGA